VTYRNKAIDVYVSRGITGAATAIVAYPQQARAPCFKATVGNKLVPLGRDARSAQSDALVTRVTPLLFGNSEDDDGLCSVLRGCEDEYVIFAHPSNTDASSPGQIHPRQGVVSSLGAGAHRDFIAEYMNAERQYMVEITVGECRSPHTTIFFLRYPEVDRMSGFEKVIALTYNNATRTLICGQLARVWGYACGSRRHGMLTSFITYYINSDSCSTPPTCEYML